MADVKLSEIWREYEKFSEGDEPVRLCSTGMAYKDGELVEVGVVYNGQRGGFEAIEELWIKRQGLLSFGDAEAVFQSEPYSGYQRAFLDRAFFGRVA